MLPPGVTLFTRRKVRDFNLPAGMLSGKLKFVYKAFGMRVSEGNVQNKTFWAPKGQETTKAHQTSGVPVSKMGTFSEETSPWREMYSKLPFGHPLTIATKHQLQEACSCDQKGIISRGDEPLGGNIQQ